MMKQNSDNDDIKVHEGDDDEDVHEIGVSVNGARMELLERLWNRIDRNDAGVLSFEEFKHFILALDAQANEDGTLASYENISGFSADGLEALSLLNFQAFVELCGADGLDVDDERLGEALKLMDDNSRQRVRAAEEEKAAVEPQREQADARSVEEEHSRKQRCALLDEFLLEQTPPECIQRARLMLRLPAGQRVQRTFSVEDNFAKVRRWAECCPWLPEGSGRSHELCIPAEFDLALAFPMHRFGADEDEMSLKALGLAPSAALLLIDRNA